MNNSLADIFNKWKNASTDIDTRYVTFTVEISSALNIFNEMLDTWGVEYYNYNTYLTDIVQYRILPYDEVMKYKTYFSEDRISDEIMENYYA